MFRSLRQPGLQSLRHLVSTASFVGCADITFREITEFSDRCTPGCLFAALPGTQAHGRDFVKQAHQRGAAAILTDRPLADVSLPQCIVRDARQVYGRVCHGVYAHPSRSLGVAGVTGTNGKTTTTWILRHLLEFNHRQTGVLGTIANSNGLESRPAQLTTPDSLSLAQALASMVQSGTTHAALEISSHALKQERTAGLQLDAAVLTNLTQDHFDYHHSFEDYASSKLKITQLLKPGGLIAVNADDSTLMRRLDVPDQPVQVRTFGLRSAADVQAESIELTPQGTSFRLVAGTRRVHCQTPLVGRHNVSNCLAAITVGMHLGLEIPEIVEALRTLPTVPGRMEMVDLGQDFSLFVDYAHSPDAIQHAIQTLRQTTSGKIILCFGAGGNRDQAKRPLMGQAASAADHVVLTSDNPRHENAGEIALQIRSGMSSSSSVHIELDRRRAIENAILLAEPGDAVLIAGKGHESIQVVGDERRPFNDVDVASQLLNEWKEMASRHSWVA